MRIKLRFENLKPVSTNAMYDGHNKSYEYLKQEREIDKVMLKMRPTLKKFMDLYDEKKHVVYCHLVIECPRDNLFVRSGGRKGCINKRCLDIDNSIKTITDSIFYNIPLIDDSQVRNVGIEDIISNDQFFYTNYFIWLQDKEEHYAKTLSEIETRLLLYPSISHLE
jgi:Holliday junction resolvase RusA-like endonuclease